MDNSTYIQVVIRELWNNITKGKFKRTGNKHKKEKRNAG